MLCRRTASSLVALAPAKLNLFLRVVGKRPDGYHDIETVMTAVDLYDTLIFRPVDHERVEFTVRMAGAVSSQSHSLPSPLAGEGGRRPDEGELTAAEIQIRSDGKATTALSPSLQAPLPPGRREENRDPIPTGADNLVVRAALLLKQQAGIAQGVHITLIKRIPWAAGLGGGSSDAAATLGGLNRLWSLGMSRENLCELASRLGSDVPFFLAPTATAICRGRGEIVEPLRVRSSLTFVIAKPAWGLSTPAVYRECQPEPEGADSAPMRRALESGRADLVAQHLRNDLQSPAKRLNREIDHLHCLFHEQSLRSHQLSGSGSAYFGVCETRRQALSVAARLRQRGIPWVRVTQSRC